MARSQVFAKSLASAMEGIFDDDEPLAPRRSSPNIAIAEQSIIEESRHSTQLVPTSKISQSRFQDRLELEEGLEGLMESIRLHGQKVPVLLRRVDGGNLEVVYGRRRVLASQKLGIDVRAMILELDDEEALVAQGIENNERLQTSFIEKALFASQVHDGGYSIDTVVKIIGVDNSLVRRMIRIVSRIPMVLLKKIGAAHGVGRRQWEALSIVCHSATQQELAALEAAVDTSLPSSDRLEALMKDLKFKAKTVKKGKTQAGRVLAVRSANRITITPSSDNDAGFLSYLEERLGSLIPDLLKEWDEKQ